jgi:peptide/nickel transport system permease protein
LFSALANTLMLALPAAVLGFSLGVLLGALAAFNRGTWLDKAFSALNCFR